MSREIKFRCWNGESFYYSGFLISSAGRVHGVSRWDMFDEAHTFSYESFSKTAILQQFTGLRDSKNNDIYEGDIIKEAWKECNPYGYRPYDFDDNSCIYAVEYKVNKFVFKMPTQGIIENWTREVIGNIFENPELLS